MPVIGFLYPGSAVRAHLSRGIPQGMKETGYVEDRNVAIEYRWADNIHDRRRIARRSGPTAGGCHCHTGKCRDALAAKAATTTIPIVFSIGSDPVQTGLVVSLNRPGGNVTGVSYMQAELAAKQIGLLHELLPEATRFAVLVNPTIRL